MTGNTEAENVLLELNKYGVLQREYTDTLISLFIQFWF